MTSISQRAQQSGPGSAPLAAPPAYTPAPAPPTYGPPAVRLSPTPLSSLPVAIRPLMAGGSPLSGAVRQPIERSLSVDLSAVRVHSSPDANVGADQLGTRAFAIGSHIFLGSGQSSSDLGVMAHEAAHTVQQQGADSIKTYTGSFTDNVYEQEAQSVAAAVQAGQAAPSLSHTGRLMPQGLLGLPTLSEAIQSARNFFAERVDSIPGYNLLTVIIAYDPVRGRPVARSAANLIRGICGLIPGGMEKYDQLQQSGVIQRAYDWVMGEITRLGITLELFTTAFRQFIDSVGITDLISPSALLQRVINIFREPVQRIVTFAANSAIKLAEFIFEGLLGPTGAQILSILKRAAGAFQTIIQDPVRFVTNLVNAVKGGIQRFAINIGQHLINGLVGWLFGALQGAGLQLPQRWDVRGVISLVLQILGLTYQRIRPRLVRLIGERPVAFLETTFDFLVAVVRGGLAAAWQKLVEFAGNLGDMVLQGIRDFVTQTIVQQAIVRLVALFNPAGAIIQAVLAIYNTIQWFVQRIQQILQLVNSVVESIASIAAGNLGGAITYIEQSMARALPVMISFLAGLLGLGRISDQIRSVIQRIQGVVDGAIGRVLDFIVRMSRSLLTRLTGGGGESAEDPATRVQNGVTAAKGIIDRYAGRRVGVLVLRPLLVATKTRYRLSSLEVVAESGRWKVEGTGSPKHTVLTDAMTDIDPTEAVGTERNPIDIDWLKPAASRYPRVYYGSPIDGPVNSRIITLSSASLRQFPPFETYFPTVRNVLPGGREMYIASQYQVDTNKQFKLGPKTSGTRQKDDLRDYLNSHGYSSRRDQVDVDHVVELQLGGPDMAGNLWPLHYSSNQGAGRALSQYVFTLPGSGQQKSLEQFKQDVRSGRDIYFRIRSVK